MYKYFIRPILFCFKPERAHNILFIFLSILSYIPGMRALLRLIYKVENKALEREVFGIKFPNPVGLAGGLDKNAEHYNILSDFGFGFVEVGSLTPLPQPGNPRPRVFRLVKDRAIINRMGINNKGIISAIENLKKKKPEVIISANIAKNTSSQGEQIAKDYNRAFTLLYDYVDMFTVNISCPNVSGLCKLQGADNLADILDGILDKRVGMDQYKPILLKLSADLEKSAIDEIIEYSLSSGIDGLVLCNTSISRQGLCTDAKKLEQIGKGGLSGAPLFNKSIEMIKYIKQKVGNSLDIIAVGGIMSEKDAQKMFDAGASLVELYTGFIYEGPGLVKRILKSIIRNS